MSGGPALREEAREVLQASLFLSVMQHTGGDPVSQGEAGSSLAPPPELPPPPPPPPPAVRPRRSDPQIVRRVSALVDSIGRCRGAFEKLVTVSDTLDQQNRLILRRADVREFVLPLLGEGESPARGVEVTTFNAEGEAFPMQFKLWCGKVFVLMGNWMAFVRATQFEESDVLKIWAFRDVRTRGLCFVISVRRSNAAGQRRAEKRARSKGRKSVGSRPLLPG